MASAPFQDRVLEFFTLRHALRDIAARPAETPTSASHGLRAAFQKREAAETLWPRGSTAEALKLAAAALEDATLALSTFPAEAPPPWLERAQSLTADAAKRFVGAPLPTLESETLPSHEQPFRTAIDSLLAVDDLARSSLASRKDLERTRNVRLSSALVLALLVVVVLARALHAPTFASATASGQHSDQSAPSKAFDGDIASGWALPDHVGQGWIDLELGSARPVRALRILASNPPFNDRDVKDARIEALLNDVVVKSVDVTFTEPTASQPNWTDVVLDARKCDHLRITVKSNYKLGVAINEIELK